MSVAVIVHISNEDPVRCEIDKLPEPTDLVLILNNPRRRDGTDLHYLDDEVTRMILPFHRVNFIQILPTAESEEVITFVRE